MRSKLVCIFILLICISLWGGGAEAFRGASDEYGFNFSTLGGEDWCQRVVKVDLEVVRDDKFRQNDDGLRQRLGRIVLSTRRYCDVMRRIEITTWLRERPVFVVEYSQRTKWKIVYKSPHNGRLKCEPSAKQQVCDIAARAFALFQKGSSAAYFDGVELTSFLNTKERHLLSWKDGELIGRMSALDKKFDAYSLEQLNANLAKAFERECLHAGGIARNQSILSEKGKAFYSFWCYGHVEKSKNLVYLEAEGYKWMISVSTPKESGLVRARIWTKTLFDGF